MKAVDFDLLLPDIGEYGTYQKFLIWFVLLPGFFPCGFHAYNQLFLTTNYDHWCKVPELDGLNLTMEEVKNISIPYQIQHGRPKYNQCHQFLRNYSEIAESIAAGASQNDFAPETDMLRGPCSNGHHFQVNNGESSIISEWQIVCDLNFYPTLALVIFGASGLIGNWIFGYIQDGIGRRPAFFIYLVIQSVFGILTAIAPEFWSWVIFRVGVGFTVPAIMGTPFVLAIEIVGPSWRTHVTLLANVVYSICLVLLSFVVWSVREWRYMSLTTCLPFFIFFSYWWIMPESPRWLIARNRVEEAEVIIRRMAKWNKKDLSFEFYEKLRQKVAFDSVDRDSLWNILSNTGLPSKYVHLLNAIHQETEKCVQMNGRRSKFFPVRTGVRHGSSVASELFNCIIDHVPEAELWTQVRG